MSNKYIEKFFLLTEQSILVNSSEMVNDNEKESQTNLAITKYTGYIKYFFGALVIIGLIYILINIHSSKIVLTKNILPKTNKVKIVATFKEPILPSVIPSFRTQTRRQFLQQVNLKRLDISMIEDSNFEDKDIPQVHITDKVLVVPKSFG